MLLNQRHCALVDDAIFNEWDGERACSVDQLNEHAPFVKYVEAGSLSKSGSGARFVVTEANDENAETKEPPCAPATPKRLAATNPTITPIRHRAPSRIDVLLEPTPDATSTLDEPRP